MPKLRQLPGERSTGASFGKLAKRMPIWKIFRALPIGPDCRGRGLGACWVPAGEVDSADPPVAFPSHGQPLRATIVAARAVCADGRVVEWRAAYVVTSRAISNE